MKSQSIILGLMLVLSGCALRPELARPAPTTALSQDHQDISEQWWVEFENPALNELIQKALKNNINLQTAYLNLKKASLALGIEKADWLPNISASAGQSRQNEALGQNHKDSYNLRAGLSYELDLWGKVRDRVDIAKAKLQASEYDYIAAQLSIATSVAKGYFELAGAMAEKEIYTKSLKSYEQTKELYAKKLALGAISQSEYLRIDSSVKSTKMNLASLQARITSYAMSLAILSGASQEEIINLQPQATSSSVPNISQNLNASLLSRRPDIASAWQNVISANAGVGLARKAWLPSISLSAGFGYASSELDRLIASPSSGWSLGASFAQMIFDGGKINANIDIAKLDKQSALLNYEATIRQALSETKTALDELNSQRKVLELLSQIKDSAQKIYELEEIKFNAGATEYISLLDAQRSLLDAQLSEARAKTTLLKDVAELFKVLGGGFSEQR